MLKSERQKLPGCMWNIPGYTLAEGKGKVDTQDNTAKGKMLNRGVLKGLWISCWDEDELHRSHIREDKNVWYYFLETIRLLCAYWVLF